MISKVRKGLRRALKDAPKRLAKWPEWKLKAVSLPIITQHKP